LKNFENSLHLIKAEQDVWCTSITLHNILYYGQI